MNIQLIDKINHLISTFKNNELIVDVIRILEKQGYHGYLSATQVHQLTLKHQLTIDSLALDLLPIAACYSYAPISQFNVGAIAIGYNNDFYFGANIEFEATAIQQTIHAEQSAISHSWMQGETLLQGIAINYPPCGHCRQFMNELNDAEHLTILLPEQPPKLLTEYLPHSFGPKDLNIQTGLLSHEQHDFKLEAKLKNNLQIHALNALNRSHAPYSKAYAGVAIQLSNDDYILGSYAENAAFNPSLPALQTALSHLLMSGYQFSDISRIMLIETRSQLSQYALARELTNSLLNMDLHYHCIDTELT